MKLPGMCSACGKPCFEITGHWPEEHPFAGQPSRIGPPHSDARRVTLTLVDGTLMTVTVHEQCIDEFNLNLPQIWRDINERYTAERKAHKVLGHKDFNAQQHAEADDEQLRFIHNRPLGVLAIEDWSNV